MRNRKFFQLQGGDVAAMVPVDVTTGQPLEGKDFHETVKIIGRCSDVDNVLRDTWDGPTALYVFPTAPMQMQIVSTAAADNSTGTGIQSVHLYYLDTDYVEREEQITLNGVTPVLTTATNIRRVNKLHAKTVGSSEVSAGTISLTAVGGGTTYSLIPAGRTFARQAIYTVPAGKFMRIEQWQVSSGSTGAHFCQHTLVATSDEGVYNPGGFLPKDEHGTQNGGDVFNYSFNIEDIPARSDVKVGVISDNAAANVIALTTIFGRLFSV